MSNYNNGPGNVPRLPDRVVDTLIDSAGVSRCAPGRAAFSVRDQSAEVEDLVHSACEELLARLPSAPAISALPPSPPGQPTAETLLSGQPEGCELPALPKPVAIGWKGAGLSEIAYGFTETQVLRIRAEGIAADRAARQAPADTPIDDLWMHEDMARDETNAVAGLKRKDLQDAYVGAREDLAIWKRRALEAEAGLKTGGQAPDGGRDAALTDAQIRTIKFAADALEGLDCEDTAGDLRAIAQEQAK